MLACCNPASGRARIEFSIWTIAGPGRLGVAVGVAAGPALAPHPARTSASPHASVDRCRFQVRIGSLSIRRSDSVARAILWYVPSDAHARNAAEPDSGRALFAQPHDGLARPLARAHRWRRLSLWRRDCATP